MNTPATDSPAAAPRHSTLVRDVLLIVAAGIALGVAYNVMLAFNRPADALSWIRREPKLASFESLAGTLPPSAPPGAPAESVATAVVGTWPAPASSTPPAATPAATATTPAKAAASPAPATSNSPPPGAVTPPVPGQAPPTVSAPSTPALPAVPETREPLEVGLDFARRFHAARGAVFVDAREASEYAAGHIAGAVSVPFDDAFAHPEVAKKLDDRGLPLIVYCGGGDCELARSLAFTLIDAGHKRVLVLKDGLPGWSGAGLPVTTGAQP